MEHCEKSGLGAGKLLRRNRPKCLNWNESLERIHTGSGSQAWNSTLACSFCPPNRSMACDVSAEKAALLTPTASCQNQEFSALDPCDPGAFHHQILHSCNLYPMRVTTPCASATANPGKPSAFAKLKGSEGDGILTLCPVPEMLCWWLSTQLVAPCRSMRSASRLAVKGRIAAKSEGLNHTTTNYLSPRKRCGWQIGRPRRGPASGLECLTCAASACPLPQTSAGRRVLKSSGYKHTGTGTVRSVLEPFHWEAYQDKRGFRKSRETSAETSGPVLLPELELNDTEHQALPCHLRTRAPREPVERRAFTKRRCNAAKRDGLAKEETGWSATKLHDEGAGAIHRRNDEVLEQDSTGNIRQPLPSPPGSSRCK